MTVNFSRLSSEGLWQDDEVQLAEEVSALSWMPEGVGRVWGQCEPTESRVTIAVGTAPSPAIADQAVQGLSTPAFRTYGPVSGSWPQDESLVGPLDDMRIPSDVRGQDGDQPLWSGCQCGACSQGSSGTRSGEALGAGRTELIDQTYNEATKRYEFTGDRDTDAVLIGSRWTPTTLTFSFPTSGSFYKEQGYGKNAEPAEHVVFNDAQQTAARYAFGLVAGYTNLTFVEVTESKTVHGDFRFSQTDLDDVGSAYANFPSSSLQAGDIWFGRTGQPFYDTPAPGNWGQATIMHELGHALGLKHGHQDYTNVDLTGYLDAPAGGGPRYGSAALPASRDGQSWSLMTYRPAPGSLEFAGEGRNQPQTYMQDDIAALQHLYGANFTTRGGDTVYRWNPLTGEMSIDGVAQGAPTANKILMTLWDGDGIDTYDLSNYSSDLDVNLEPGAFSTFSTAQLANHLAYTGGNAPAAGNLANARLFEGDLRSLIENATGGVGDDSMIGNQAANTLRGNGGADRLIGSAGSDWLYGGTSNDILAGDSYSLPSLASDLENAIGSGAGDDWLSGGKGDDTLIGGGGIDTASYAEAQGKVVVNLQTGLSSGADGVDTLSGIENLAGSAFSDQLTGNGLANELNGAAGKDRLTGGGGADLLIGGAGKDRFVFLSTADSIDGARDLISDMLAGDILDLSAIDANEGVSGNQAFVFAASLTGAAGQYTVSFNEGQSLLEADTDGDGLADLSILFTGDVRGLMGAWVL